jgi:hypothetical protein
MLRALRARWYLTVAVVIVAVVAAVAVKTKSNSVPTGAATVQIMVDSPQSALADLKQDPLPLTTRAAVFAQLMTSDAILRDIAQTAGVARKDLTAEGPYSGGGQPLDVPTPSPARSAQVLATSAPYHLTFVPDATIPLVTASVAGPSPAAAGKVANAIGPGVRTWLTSLQGAVPAYHRVTIRVLGSAQAGSVNSGSGTTMAGIAGAAILLIGLLGIAALDRRQRRDSTPSEMYPSIEDEAAGFSLGPDGLDLEPYGMRSSADDDDAFAKASEYDRAQGYGKGFAGESDRIPGAN